MLGLARRIVGGKPEAEDIVHDVFVEAWRRAADYDENRGSVKAWLLLRTRSRAIDHRKSASVARTVVAGDGAWLAVLVDPRAGDAEAPDRARLRGVALSLSEDQQEVLYLGYFEGLSSSEIATRLGIPIGTVKSRGGGGTQCAARGAGRSTGERLMSKLTPSSLLPDFAGEPREQRSRAERARGAVRQARRAEPRGRCRCAVPRARPACWLRFRRAASGSRRCSAS